MASPNMSPADIVREYLRLCEERRLDEAARHLAPDAILIFPGGVTHASLDNMVAGAANRYSWVHKSHEHLDIADREDGSFLVTARGTLRGENLEGVAFQGVRFVDVFVIRDGLIQEQHVWNDLADSGALGNGPESGEI